MRLVRGKIYSVQGRKVDPVKSAMLVEQLKSPLIATVKIRDYGQEHNPVVKLKIVALEKTWAKALSGILSQTSWVQSERLC